MAPKPSRPLNNIVQAVPRAPRATMLIEAAPIVTNVHHQTAVCVGQTYGYARRLRMADYVGSGLTHQLEHMRRYCGAETSVVTHELDPWSNRGVRPHLLRKCFNPGPKSVRLEITKTQIQYAIANFTDDGIDAGDGLGDILGRSASGELSRAKRENQSV